MKPCAECKRKNVKYHQKCLNCPLFICEDCYVNKGIKMCEDCDTVISLFSLFKIYR